MMLELYLEKKPMIESYIRELQEKLRPCPFCGGDAKIMQESGAPYSFVECDSCGARSGTIPPITVRDERVQYEKPSDINPIWWLNQCWNKRYDKSK